jgi:hypothetical protein
MADVERIVPPVPTVPPGVGRTVGSRRRAPDKRAPHDEAPHEEVPQGERRPQNPGDDVQHIDEYV